jgi:predicted acylesterase/phospholipase RssA
MGEIALSRHPQALALFRQVILASVSIPVAFPPVRIEVEAGGEVRDELHVDGGTTCKVFIAPLQLSLHSLDPLHSAPPLHRFYIIANTKLESEWKQAEASVVAIAQSAIAALNKDHSTDDLFRLYLLAKRDGADFNLAAIPASFSQQSRQPFDRHYMQALFDAGVARGGAQWLKEPPELGQTQR